MSATTILLILLFAFAMIAMHRGGHRHGAGGHGGGSQGGGSHGGGDGRGHVHSDSTDGVDRGEETGRPPASPSTDRDDEHQHAPPGAA